MLLLFVRELRISLVLRWVGRENVEQWYGVLGMEIRGMRER